MRARVVCLRTLGVSRETLPIGIGPVFRVNLGGMDELLVALIEVERELDETFANIGDVELEPIAMISDCDGSRIEVFADGSYVGFADDGTLL